TTQKRLAAQILKCSKKKIWLDPAESEEIKEAITKADVRSLIIKKIIKKMSPPESSRFRARILSTQKKKGRRKGAGSRQGKKTARTPSKRVWMNLIRSQREILKALKDSEKIDNATFRQLYLKAKGGFFRSKRHLKLYIQEHGLCKNDDK
ncbi:MAG: 50S ribosomal protein L19e, partial [Nanoarchaeota archaeon]|nr:50S ribosomal protein L19e [Nanoarchaeota archaeon]MBU1704661.1 50S ribosomal protein L19e [Nanoarchaeota archaeon]